MQRMYINPVIIILIILHLPDSKFIIPISKNAKGIIEANKYLPCGW